jgi:hypothetical protein
MCEHLERKEVLEGVLHIQKCLKCGMVREYNPFQKRNILPRDPDMWSEWVESNCLVANFFS